MAAETETPPRSFYKIILPAILDDNKMRIPDKFAKIYENELSSFATLVLPNGQSFRIKLQKAEKMLWLHKGWKEFVEHQSIRCGFFLLFDYEGNSKFKVHIFDLTATEIKYHKNENKSEVLRKRGTKPSPILAQETTFHECSLQGVKRKKCIHSVLSTLFLFAPEFAMRMNNYGECISKLVFNSLRTNSHYQTRNKRCRSEDLGETVNVEDIFTCEGTQKAIVGSNMPTDSEMDESVLENENSVVNSGFPSESRQKHHCFAEDLEDMQLATPINKDDQVKVKKEEEELIGVSDPNILSTKSIVQGKEKAVNAALMLKLKNPYFLSILKQRNVDLSYILHVPVYFGNKYLSSETQFLKLEGPDGKKLEVSSFSDGSVRYLSRGWVVFVKEYNLGEGDVCVFELIQADDVVLKVHIFKACETSL